MTKLKVGFISFAHMHAVSYLKALAKIPEVTLVGIADESRDRVQTYLEQYDLPYYANVEDLLAADIDAVVVCSENVKHAQIVEAAAKARKHILCEKPLGTSKLEMQQMVDVCSENGVQLMTAFPCRYIPAVVEAKAAIDRGDIGDILAIKGTNRGSMPGSWFIDTTLSAGGAVLDHTVHVMDLMNWMLGSTVTEVYAEVDTLFHDIDIDDAGMVHMKFSCGAVAVLDPSWSRSQSFPTWGDVTMEIVGTKGVLSIDAFAQYNEVYRDDQPFAEWSYWGDGMDDLLVSGFVKAILGDKPVPISGIDGMKSAVVAFAAYESAAQGKPVKL